MTHCCRGLLVAGVICFSARRNQCRAVHLPALRALQNLLTRADTTGTGVTSSPLLAAAAVDRVGGVMDSYFPSLALQTEVHTAPCLLLLLLLLLLPLLLLHIILCCYRCFNKLSDNRPWSLQLQLHDETATIATV